MKQIVQNYRTGELWLEDVPTPVCRRGGVLVRNEYSVVSTGTERMKVDQARMSLLEKAKARPDKVKQVLQSVGQVGLKETYNKVQERLDSLTPLGYSSVGTVVEVGEGIDNISVGDKVACAGEGIACHAEYVFVPRNLCALVPEGVELRDAAFSTVGAIAINGVRQAQVAVGDTVLVIGLGLVGLLGVQILNAAGCRVIGVDIDESKMALAKACGAEATFLSADSGLPQAVEHLTNGRGVDAVYIAASTSKSDPMDMAGELVRDRGNVVVVGMVPVHADWRVYYAKELNIIMARSYGPGRYDRNYENKGIDYPVGYVPWTQRRNLEEFMRLIQVGKISPSKLGSAQFDHADAPNAYKEMHEAPGKHAVGIIFKYPEAAELQRKIMGSPNVRAEAVKGNISVAMIGAGNFATGTLIPALKSADAVRFKAICSAGGLSAKSAANRHGFEYATSDVEEVWNDRDIDAVVIATRHDTHAKFATEALRSGKHVFVEKPMALNLEDLAALMAAQKSSGKILMPGFNRRFSPLSKSVKEFFSPEAGPVEIVCRVNAGPIGADSWYQDAEEGGWRIVSEGCHFVDLISYISGGLPEYVTATMIGGNVPGGQNDNCIVTLEMNNGSIATLIYVANGDSHFEKERIEVFGQQRAAVIRNWHSALLSYNGKQEKIKPGATGKGHKGEIQSFIEAIRHGQPAPIEPESAFRTTLATLKIQESLLDGGRKSLLD